MSTTIKLNDSTITPWIAFGTGTALYKSDASAQVKTAITAGFTHLDGAQVYENEDSMGKGIAESGKDRSTLFVTTKLSSLNEGETVKESLQKSLKKLGMDYVDLFLVHSPTQHKGRLQEVWKEMEGVKRDGLAKSIGVSNFGVKNLTEVLEIATIKPSVNQIEYHPYLFKTSEPLMKVSREHGIVTASYGGLSPITRAKEDHPLKDVLPSIRSRLEKSYGKPITEGQILMKWMQQKGVLVVTTSSKPERLAEYLSTAQVPELTAEEIQSIETYGSKSHQRFFGGFWGE